MEYLSGDLIEMITIQPGAVVSKTLVKKEKGTVTLFGFSEGQGLSEHTAPFDALVQVLQGEVEIVLGGKDKVILNKGNILVMPANISHSLKAKSDMIMLLTMIRE